MLTLSFSAILLFVLVSFAAGYAFGRLDLLVKHLLRQNNTPTYVPPQHNTLRAAMQESTARSRGKIDIDAGKYVGEINTAGMQKMQDIALGKTTQTQDDISSSVSKLAQLKGK